MKGVTIRDVDIRTALVIPENDDGVETMFNLQPSTNETGWHTFSVESLTDSIWTLHCTGKISANSSLPSPENIPVDEATLTKSLPGRTWYSAFDRVGFHYGPSFQQLQDTLTNNNLRQATGNIKVVESSGLMDGESRYLIHPSTVDACLQLIIVSIHAGKNKEMPWGVVPTHIQEISLYPAKEDALSVGHAVAWTDAFDQRRFNTHARLTGPSGRVLVEVKHLTCVTYEAALPAGSTSSVIGPQPFSVVSWKPDIATLSNSDLLRLLPDPPNRTHTFCKMLELIFHRQSVTSVLVCGNSSASLLEAIVNLMPHHARLTVSLFGEEEVTLSEKVRAFAVMKPMGTSPDDLLQTCDESHDIVILDLAESAPRCSPETFLPLISDNGWILGSSNHLASTQTTVQIGTEFALAKAASYTNGVIPHEETITILSLSSLHDHHDLREMISSAAQKRQVEVKTIENFSRSYDKLVVVDDRAGTLFASMSANAVIFDAVKTVLTSGSRMIWVTKGVKEGKSPTAGMAEGFLRAIRSEIAAARFILLDIDCAASPRAVGLSIVSKLDFANTKNSASDLEFWLHEEALHICRVSPDDYLNQSSSKTQTKLLPQGQPLQPLIVDGDLLFGQGTLLSSGAEETIDIQVLASEFHIPNSGPHLLVCGTVVNTGSAVSIDFVGRRAIAFTNDGPSTVLRTSDYVILEEDENANCETLVQAFLSIFPLINLSSISTVSKQPTTVISLPGPKHIMEMMGRLARAAGWTLTIIVSSTDESEQYTSQLGYHQEQVLVGEDATDVAAIIRRQYVSSGPLTVVAHDFSPLSEETWRSLPPSCRFVLSETPIDVSPDSLPFMRGASFICTNSKTLRASSQASSDLLRSSSQLVRRYPSLLQAGNHSFKIVDPEQLTRLLSGTGGENNPLVIQFRYGENHIAVR